MEQEIDFRYREHIREIFETTSYEEANQYLKNGWILLQTGFSVVKDVPRFHYSLGYPESSYRAKQLWGS